MHFDQQDWRKEIRLSDVRVEDLFPIGADENCVDLIAQGAELFHGRSGELQKQEQWMRGSVCRRVVLIRVSTSWIFPLQSRFA